MIFGSSSFEEEHLESIESAVGVERCRRIEEAAELSLPASETTQQLVVYRRGHGVQESKRLFARLREFDRSIPTICVVEDGEWREATSALREGATDYLFVEQLESDYLTEMLRVALGRSTAGNRRRRVHRELEERSSELLGMNALANGVSNTLDRETIIRRGLWVFAGVGHHAAVALLELRPREALREHQGGEAEEVPSGLEKVGMFSSGDVEGICGDIAYDDSWKNAIGENQVALLDDPPEAGEFPGLEAFWEAHPDGELVLLPLHTSRGPLGALLLARVGDSEEGVGLTRDGLRAMGIHFASALENARLFEEVKEAYESLQETQDQLVHAEKFAAVGLLAAEIAHEINNPASFVISNLSVMNEYVEAIANFLDELERHIRENDSDLFEDLDALKERYEISFMRDDMGALLSRSLSGMQRIHQIVQDLRYLSRDSERDPGWIEIDSLLDATVNLVRHEAKFRAQLELDYGDVPQVMSDASRLSQVLLNLLVNAVQAIEVGEVEENEIRVKARQIDDAVRIAIEDTGEGIDPEDKERIFDPFFSTKETGEGTGLGLSISRDIIRSLGGELDFESEPGEGTRFEVTIPIRAEKFAEDRDLRDSGYYDTPPGLEDDVFGS